MKRTYEIVLLGALSLSAHASTNSVCGAGDDRIPSRITPIGRTIYSPADRRVCTATLISPSCIISAGHCANSIKVVQFNVPYSKRDRSINDPALLFQYSVDEVVGFADEKKNYGSGDWVVLHVRPNPISHQRPGDIHGYFRINTNPIASFIDHQIRVTGFGSSIIPEHNYAQQTAVGVISNIRYSYPTIIHTADTSDGSSGAPIILNATQEIVGVQNNGGCNDGGNEGTSIGDTPDFFEAIKKCVAIKP